MTLPDLEPAALEAAARCINRNEGITAAIRAYLSAARSAPEAGKAVEWQEPPLTCPHIDAAVASGELSEAVVDDLATIRDINSQLRYGTWVLKAQLEAALASVPAPSGEEPKLDTRILPETQAALDAIDENIRSAAMRASTTFFGAPQAVPAEDVAELVERAISKALGWQPSEDGPSYRETRQEVERLLAAASEAEAASLREQLAVLQRRFDLELDAYAKDSDMADLRRKLEEHRKMLAEARERINRYADTAAEHDLVARIDALAAPFPEDTHHGR